MARHVYKHNGRNSNQMLLSGIDQQVLVVNCAPGAKSLVYDCLVLGTARRRLGGVQDMIIEESIEQQ